MAILDVRATRMELNSLKNKLEIATKGHRLLKNKSDGLVRNFFKLVNDFENLKTEVLNEIKAIFFSF